MAISHIIEAINNSKNLLKQKLINAGITGVEDKTSIDDIVTYVPTSHTKIDIGNFKVTCNNASHKVSLTINKYSDNSNVYFMADSSVTIDEVSYRPDFIINFYNAKNVSSINALYNGSLLQNACMDGQNSVIPTTVDSLIGVFNNCSSLTNANFVVNTPLVKSAASMFSGCTNLIDLPRTFNAPILNSMHGTFANCESLRSDAFDSEMLNIQSNVSDMNYSKLFSSCTNLTGLLSDDTNYKLIKRSDSSTFAVQNVSQMFAECHNFNGFINYNNSDYRIWDETTSDYTMLFKNCYNYNKPTIIGPNSIDITYVFSGCSKLRANVTLLSENYYNAEYAFANTNGCPNMTINTTNLDSLNNIFAGMGTIDHAATITFTNQEVYQSVYYSTFTGINFAGGRYINNGYAISITGPDPTNVGIVLTMDEEPVDGAAYYVNFTGSVNNYTITKV